MDASGHYIPIVEDDQGEGMKDPCELEELSLLKRRLLEIQGDIGPIDQLENLREVKTREYYRKKFRKT